MNCNQNYPCPQPGCQTCNQGSGLNNILPIAALAVAGMALLSPKQQGCNNCAQPRGFF